MMRELQTARLVLRPLQLSDAAQVQALFPHWEIVQYLVRTRSEVYSGELAVSRHSGL